MPHFNSPRSRGAIAAIGAVLLLCGVLMLATESYLHYSGGEVRLSAHRYLRVQSTAPFLLLAVAFGSAVLGAAAMLWARWGARG